MLILFGWRPQAWRKRKAPLASVENAVAAGTPGVPWGREVLMYLESWSSSRLADAAVDIKTIVQPKANKCLGSTSHFSPFNCYLSVIL